MDTVSGPAMALPGREKRQARACQVLFGFDAKAEHALAFHGREQHLLSMNRQQFCAYALS